MARARLIKPRFFGNELLAEVSPLGRLLFIALWTIADREGRLEYRPKRIKIDCLPYDNCDIQQLIVELEKYGFILVYEVNNNQYIQIVNFVKHQNPHKNEQASELPVPVITGAARVISGTTTEKIGSTRALTLNPLTLTLNPLTENETEKNDATSHCEPDKPDHQPDAGTDTQPIERQPLPKSANEPLDLQAQTDFEIFRAAYPVASHRREALVAYGTAIRSGVTHQTIMAAVDRLKQSIDRGDITYPTNPARWLDDRGWENSYKPKQKSSDGYKRTPRIRGEEF